MKAKDLLDVEPETYVRVRWYDTGGFLTGPMERAVLMHDGRISVDVNTIHSGYQGTHLEHEEEVTVFPGIVVKGKYVEAIQFTMSRDILKKIAQFVVADEWEVDLHQWGPRGTFSNYRLGIAGVLWAGDLLENDWLVKHKDQVVKLAKKEYEVLYGEVSDD